MPFATPSFQLVLDEHAVATRRSLSHTPRPSAPQIAKWYDNQRAKIKRRERLSGSGGGSPEDHDSLSTDDELHHQVDSLVDRQDDDAADMHAMASFMEMQAARQVVPKTAESAEVTGSSSTRLHREDDLLHQQHDRHSTDEEDEELGSPGATRHERSSSTSLDLLAVRSVSGGVPDHVTRIRPREPDSREMKLGGGGVSEPPVKRIRAVDDTKIGGDTSSGSDCEVV